MISGYRIIDDDHCLDLLADHLSDREWDASDLKTVAELIRQTGRVISGYQRALTIPSPTPVRPPKPRSVIL